MEPRLRPCLQSPERKVSISPCFAFPCFEQKFVLDCDASDYGLGAVISQREDETEKVIAYASRVLEDRERWYSTTKKEMLAMVYAIKHCHHYLYGRPFTVRTNHNALKWLQSFKEPEGQVARCLETLAQDEYKIEHRPGKRHQNADALSRNPLPVAVNAVCSSDQARLQSWTAAELQSKQAEYPNLRQILLWKQNQTTQPAPQRAYGRSGTGYCWRTAFSTANGRLKMALAPGYSLCFPDH